MPLIILLRSSDLACSERFLAQCSLVLRDGVGGEDLDKAVESGLFKQSFFSFEEVFIIRACLIKYLLGGGGIAVSGCLGGVFFRVIVSGVPVRDGEELCDYGGLTVAFESFIEFSKSWSVTHGYALTLSGSYFRGFAISRRVRPHSPLS